MTFKMKKWKGFADIADDSSLAHLCNNNSACHDGNPQPDEASSTGNRKAAEG